MDKDDKFSKLKDFLTKDCTEVFFDKSNKQSTSKDACTSELKTLQNTLSNLQNIDTTNRIIENNIEKLKESIERLEKKEEKDTNFIYIILGFIFAMLAFFIPLSIEWKLDPIEQNINSKFEIIQNQLNMQKEINELIIQRDVAKEVTNKH